jgi:hypothetical protein
MSGMMIELKEKRMSKIEEEGMLVNLDIRTVENITTRYLMELYTELQGNIAMFMKDTIQNGSPPLDNWEKFQKWHDESESCRRILNVLMECDEYCAFVEKVYKKSYPHAHERAKRIKK